MHSPTTEQGATATPRHGTDSEAPKLIIQVDEIPVARERCATVGKNGNNRAEPTAR